MIKRFAVITAAVATVSALTIAPAAAATYPPGGPNDPEYAPAEQGGPGTCLHTSVNSEQHYLYSFEPKCAPLAHDPVGAAGMSVDKAWSTYTTGDPKVTIAYIEGGINWNDNPAAKDLVNQVYLNTGELPLPEDKDGNTHPKAGGHGYDLNGDGQVNVADYAHDPRVTGGEDQGDANGNGYLDPEDLIVAFSNGKDDDHNGFVDDISGWDFYDHQNDPSMYDSTYDHSDNQMLQAAAEGNNGLGKVGVCPGCTILPIKAGDEALDRTDDLAQAWLYADHMNASVIVSVTADLGYSSYMRQAVEKCWHDGVLMVEASNDFNSTDHQGGMFWPHVLPGNGLVSNTQGLDKLNPKGLTSSAINLLTKTFSERSNETSWGTHNMFSAATDGGSTSESTPTVGGAFALLLSYGRQAYAEHRIDHPLTNAEAVQVMRATADDITGNPNPPTGWKGAPGWDVQYGYGRPDLYRAMTAVKNGDIPPAGSIESPRWYSLYDPEQTDAVPVTGEVTPDESGPVHWTVQYGLGRRPTDWHDINSGETSKPTSGKLGTLDLAKIPKSFWTKRFHLSKTKSQESEDEYTVTLRLKMTAGGQTGIDRRAIAVHHDPSSLPGFPKRIGPGGASQPAMADLAGSGHLDLVYGDSDGLVHALDPKTGKELPGWPVHTRATRPQHAYAGIDPGHEPILDPVTIGDLSHTGALDVVATSTTGRVYVWDAHGKLLPGWPKTLNKAVITAPIPRSTPGHKDRFTRLAHLGATAPPMLVDLDAGRDSDTHKLDVVQPAWDGNIYAWQADGTPVHGWPVHVHKPAGSPPNGLSLIDDQKLDLPLAVADLNGDGKPEIVAQSQYSDIRGAGIQVGGIGHVYAFHADGTPVPGWPASVHSLIIYYGSAQEFITEGSTAPAVADLNGDGKDEVAVTDGIFSPVSVLNGSAKVVKEYGPVPSVNPLTELLNGNLDVKTLLGQLASGKLPTGLPVTFTSSGAFGKFGLSSRLGFAQAGADVASVGLSLLLVGSGIPVANYERGYGARRALPKLGFPQQMQGLDFLGAPVIADVTGDGRGEVIDGGDTSALHGFTQSHQARGFPKFQTGWILFSPTVGDLDSDGTVDVAATTREGYLMAWNTPGTDAGNKQWWTYHHGEWRQGRYGVDTRPPGALLHARRNGRTVSFTAPGDDWYAGRVASYRVSAGGHTSSVPASAPAGQRQQLQVPARAGRIVVQAVDDAGNLSPKLVLGQHTASPPSAGQGGHEGGSGQHPAGSTRRSAEASVLPFTGLGATLPAVAALVLLAGAFAARRRRVARR